MKESIKKFYKNVKNDIYHIRKNINYIHNISGKSRIVIFFDILYSSIRYGISDNEYRIFEFYRIKRDKRRTYLSISKHKRIAWLIEDKKNDSILENKKDFIKEYIDRKIYDVNKMTFKEFEDFALGSKKVLARSPKKSIVKSFKVFDVNDYRSPAFMSEDIKKSGLNLVEKYIFKDKNLSNIDDSFILINVTTFDGEVMASSIKYKEDGQIISGSIDIKKGILKGHLKDEDGKNYSGIFEGFEIPSYNKIIEYARDMSVKLSDIREVEWSFALDNKGKVHLMDANKYDDFVFAQTPEFLVSRVGFLPKYKKHISLWR